MIDSDLESSYNQPWRVLPEGHGCYFFVIIFLCPHPTPPSVRVSHSCLWGLSGSPIQRPLSLLTSPLLSLSLARPPWIMQLLSIAPAEWRMRRKHVGGDGGRLNRSRRPHSFGKQGSGNLSNWGEHVLGPWIGKQQASPYVSLCHKDALAYLPWQTGLPETINLARFIKIKQWPLTSPLSVRQMPRSNSIGLERSLSPFSLL